MNAKQLETLQRVQSRHLQQLNGESKDKPSLECHISQALVRGENLKAQDTATLCAIARDKIACGRHDRELTFGQVFVAPASYHKAVKDHALIKSKADAAVAGYLKESREIIDLASLTDGKGDSEEALRKLNAAYDRYQKSLTE